MRASTIEERGAILIQVAISILALTAMSAFVLDYGVMWMSRRQAQNAADAGALAGATARAFDETVDPPAVNGPTFQAATKAAAANNVWLTPPAVDVTWPCPTFITGGRCVRVDVYQDGTHGSSTLPTFFAPLFGISTQGTLATATAQVAVANATDCLKPWGIPDKWTEGQNPPFDNTDTFSRYANNGSLVANADLYTPPSTSSTGTGYNVTDDYGTQVILHPDNGGGSVAPGDWLGVDLPDGAGGYNTGGAAYEAALATCTGHAVAIGDYLPVESGAKVGPTTSGVQALIALDPGASWSGSGLTGKIINSCAPGVCADGLYHTLSPRVAAVAVYNTDKFQYSGTQPGNWTYCPGGGICVQVTNILGFFVASVANGAQVTGYFFNYPGIFKTGSPSVGTGSSFAQFIQLVR
jgi:hypothetical protein